jgi:RimJ/RimL family protein N-acetyltransferase
MARRKRLHRRLGVRPVRPSDRALLRSWLRDPELHDRLEDTPITEAAVRRKIRYYENPAYDDDSLHLIIELDGSPIGLVHYVWQNFQSRTVEMDLLIAAPYRRSMVAFLAMLKAADVAFNELNHNKVYSFVYESNSEVIAIHQRTTTREATLQGQLLRNGRPQNVFIYALLAAEYRKLAKRYKRIF